MFNIFILKKERLKYLLHIELLSKILFFHENMGKLAFYPTHLLSNTFLSISNINGLNNYPLYV